jgi:hypothetical protein
MAAPSKGEAAKRHIITMRVTPAMRERIQAAAEQNGRSVSQEIETRLEMSFQGDRFFGGSATPRLLRAIGQALDALEGRTGQKWYCHRDTWAAALLAINSIIVANRPVNVGRTVSAAELDKEIEKSIETMNALENENYKFWEENPSLAAWEDDVRKDVPETDREFVPNDVLTRALYLCLSFRGAIRNFMAVREKDRILYGTQTARDAEVVEIAKGAARDALSLFRVTPDQREVDDVP